MSGNLIKNGGSQNRWQIVWVESIPTCSTESEIVQSCDYFCNIIYDCRSNHTAAPGILKTVVTTVLGFNVSIIELTPAITNRGNDCTDDPRAKESQSIRWWRRKNLDKRWVDSSSFRILPHSYALEAQYSVVKIAIVLLFRPYRLNVWEKRCSGSLQ